MRTRKALYNVAGQVVSQLVTILSGFILPRLLLTAYGSMVNGLVTSIRQMLVYLGQLEMGLAGASILALYKPLATGDDAEASRVLSASRHFYRQTGIFFTIGALFLGFSYPFIIDSGNLSWSYVTIIVLLLALPGAASFFLLGSAKVLLLADQRSYVASIVASVVGVASLGAVVWAILAGGDVIWVPIVSAISVFAQALLLLLYYRRAYGNRFRFDLPVQKGIIAQRWNVFIDELAFMIQLNSPIIIVTFMLGLISVSVFSIYNMVFRSLHSMVRMLPLSLQASFGEVISLGQMDRLRQAYSEYEYIIYLLTAWIYTMAGILLLPFIRAYTHGITDADYMRPTLGALFLFIGVIRQVQTPSSTLITAAGKYREIRSNSIQVTISSVILGIVGAYAWGLEGVLLGLAIACVHKAAFHLYLTHRYVLLQKPWRLFSRLIRNGVLSIIAWLPFVGLIEIAPMNLWQWCAWAMGVLVWVGVVLVLGNVAFDWQTSRSILHRMKSVLNTPSVKPIP